MRQPGNRRALVFSAIAALLLLACSIEEDLRINSDGSGIYRIRVSIPKELAGLDDFRNSVAQKGFRVEQEGETDKERFIVIRKEFTDIRTLGDSQNRFELTITDSGLLRREYRLRMSLAAIGFGGYQRRVVVTMPGNVQSASQGAIEGRRVTWEGKSGRIEIIATGFHVPLSRVQRIAAIVAVTALLLMFLRRKRTAPATTTFACPSCRTSIHPGARFCRDCGGSVPVPES